MNDRDSRTELQRLEAEYPNLLALLKRTPAPPEVDTDRASGEDILAARALAIIGTAAGRTRNDDSTGSVVLSVDGLRALIASLTETLGQTAEMEKLRSEVAQLRSDQVTADGVRVITAKVLAAILAALATLVAIVGGTVALL